MPVPESTALLLGPVLRMVTGGSASIWVQTGHPATVEVRAGTAGGAARTFTVFDRHYALVVVDGLAADAVVPYQVFIDDEQVWPPADYRYPAPVLRTRPHNAPVRLVFGSCREATPYTAGHFPPDALDSYAVRLAGQVAERGAGAVDWPDCLLLLGDQVYADETSTPTRTWLRRRRKRRVRYDDAPGDQVVDYGEYARLYLESWSDPEIRWLLSCVPAAMIFDDHEVIDDWNTSESWRADMSALPWWQQRITAGMASYWVYQHLGNLHPDQLGADPVYAAIRGAADPDEATAALRDFGRRADTDRHAYRWSHHRDIGATRIVMVDNRAARVLTPGARAMLPEADWAWLTGLADAAAGDPAIDHLVLGSSLPWLMPHGIHHLEAAIERWGDRTGTVAGRLAEKVRRVLDLEHWAAFGTSFATLSALAGRLAAGSGLASVSVLSGDVHHSYVARAGLDGATPVHQLTCSPVHNQVPGYLRPAFRSAWNPAGAAVGRWLARRAGVGTQPVSWHKLAGPYFGNAVGTLAHSGGTARVVIEGADPDGNLFRVADQELTTPA